MRVVRIWIPGTSARMRFKQIIGLLLGHMAAHVLQNVVADVLQGDVEVVAHVGVTTHHRQNVVGELRGIGIMQPYHFTPGICAMRSMSSGNFNSPYRSRP